MKFVWQLLLLFFITLLLVFYFSLSSNADFSSRCFVFSVFNVVFCAVLVGDDRKSAQDFDGISDFLGFGYEVDWEEKTMDEMSSDEDDDDFYDSDGYDSEIEWTDDDNDDDTDEDDDEELKEYDQNLEGRIEEFIAKVIKGWREELLMEKMNSNQEN
ncbi:phosphopantothenoylcysteine decarboxylase subunit VHS3-like [Sesamum indicum]|uniref:Phosphopantothenoylcysteine decarboxylase subunit VHS3-like n=1 Tax=Sesamum indicum TaxID=4182 RepID=A0A8M8UXR0_SESIN|nr:phosphopantothenoylcysteine decarboxylase subunit VHS3-like [Sesamum indicum]